MSVPGPAPTARQWLGAARRSHDRLAGIVAPLSGDDLDRGSACREWTVAQVLSHLGSQAEIFSLFFEAGLSGGEAPSQQAFAPIWDAWNARSPYQQATDSVAANDALLGRLEELSDDVLGGFRLALFGRDMDAAGVLRMRLSEHALHTWDVAVAFDPGATVAADAVELLVDGLGDTVGRAGRPSEQAMVVDVVTTDPERRFRLHTGGVSLQPAEDTDGADREASRATLSLPAEGFIRLVTGRMGEGHPTRGPVHAEGTSLAELRAVFPGF